MSTAAAALVNLETVRNALEVATTFLFTLACLYSPQPVIEDKFTVDYIIVGGGTSGSIIANRLTENPKTTVLLIEAGGNPNKMSELPELVPYLTRGSFEWDYKDQNNDYTNFKDNSIPIFGQGKMLGGSSSVNHLNYIRGTPADYDACADLIGDDSWKYENILKYFKKAERYDDLNKLNSQNRKYHGTDGYMGVTKLVYDSNAIYFQAAQEFEVNVVDDFNAEYQTGYGSAMVTIANNIRQSTAYTYLSGRFSTRKNLIIYRNTIATRILFDDNKKAIGVEAINEDETFKYYAKKEVIISAGPFGSPKLLLISGIGPEAELNDKNIDCISDLPVGKNLQDHAAVAVLFNMGTIMYPTCQSNPNDFPTPMFYGALALDRNANTPDFVTYIYRLNSELFMVFCLIEGFTTEMCDAMLAKINPGPGVEVLFTFMALVHPKSRGSVTLRSTNPLDKPLIKLGRFSVEEDKENFAKYLEFYMTINQTVLFKEIKAFAAFVDLPDTDAAPGSIEYWKSYVSNLALTFESYAGTCAVGDVVDSNFNVNGVEGLRVADVSVLPLITSGAMSAPGVMIGEKCADVIKSGKK